MIIGIASADHLMASRSQDGVEQWGGAGWARIGQYVEHYRALGHTVVTGILWKNEDHLEICDTDNVRHTPDVIILQRLMQDGVGDATRIGRAAGQVVINDLDDWFWGLDTSNQAFKATHPKTKLRQVDLMGNVYEKDNPETLHHYGSNLAASSLLTVSTPYLAERMSKRVRCPIVVVPNYIDVSRFTPVVQNDDPLTPPLFGWAGSTGHRSGDLETVAGVLRPRIMNGTIAFHHSGDWPEVSPPFADMIGVPRHLVSVTPRCTSRDYPSLLHFDVGIIPLRDTPFNHAKSDIKGLEYAAAGIPFIAQDSDSYARLHKEWDGAFHLARRPKDWIAGINRYLDYGRRVEDQARLLELVQQRDIKIGAKLWAQVLEGAEP